MSSGHVIRTLAHCLWHTNPDCKREGDSLDSEDGRTIRSGCAGRRFRGRNGSGSIHRSGHENGGNDDLRREAVTLRLRCQRGRHACVGRTHLAAGVRHRHGRTAILRHLLAARRVVLGRETGKAGKCRRKQHHRQHEPSVFPIHTHSVNLPLLSICWFPDETTVI